MRHRNNGDQSRARPRSDLGQAGPNGVGFGSDAVRRTGKRGRKGVRNAVGKKLENAALFRWPGRFGLPLSVRKAGPSEIHARTYVYIFL